MKAVLKDVVIDIWWNVTYTFENYVQNSFIVRMSVTQVESNEIPEICSSTSYISWLAIWRFRLEFMVSGPPLLIPPVC